MIKRKFTLKELVDWEFDEDDKIPKIFDDSKTLLDICCLSLPYSLIQEFVSYSGIVPFDLWKELGTLNNIWQYKKGNENFSSDWFRYKEGKSLNEKEKKRLYERLGRSLYRENEVKVFNLKQLLIKYNL